MLHIFYQLAKNTCKEKKLNKKNKNKKNSIIWLFTVALIAVGLLVFCQFYFDSSTPSEAPNSTLSQETEQSAQGGISRQQIREKIENSRENANITIKNENKNWNISKENLSLPEDLDERIDQALCQGDIEKTTIMTSDFLEGIDEIISVISNQTTNGESLIYFSPDQEQMFALNPTLARQIDTNLLKEKICLAIEQNQPAEIEIPFLDIPSATVVEDFINQISLRGKFETDISRSSADRKQNIALALSNFHGMIVQPGQEVSFNQTTGRRSQENGYKNAKIIVDGKYVPGVGGGVCQASTTLYNALLLSDVEVLQSFHHTLPASYVPLSFDAMVSEGYADLVFKNTLDTPIFIKAYTTTDSAVVEIYGMPFAAGRQIRTRTELVKIIPHSGDDIIQDRAGEYENHVLYKGEYFRLKYPQEGYETKGYIQYYQDGILQEEKLVRHDRYLPQNGVIVEGAFDLEDGMSLPTNKVRYIPPQKLNEKSLENAKIKLGLN